jgi:hypothetical protein
MTKKDKVRAAALSGFCNTSLDVADETGLDGNLCSSYLDELMREGLIRKTERRLPNKHPRRFGRQLHVFEVVR